MGGLHPGSMPGLQRQRPAEIGSARARAMRRRIADEIRIVRVSGGLSQRELGRRAGYSQSFVSQVERAAIEATLEAIARLVAAGGGEVNIRVYAGEGVRLRDSGQLEVAELISHAAHPSWTRSFEVPIAPPPDRRAGDMLLQLPVEVSLLEIERALVDFQGQYRAAQLKRLALAERLGRSVNLLLVLLDTRASRRAVTRHEALAGRAFPISSRRAWASIRAGEPIGGDAILWVRPRDIRAGQPTTPSPGKQAH